MSGGRPPPRVINVDGHPAYPTAIAELKPSGELGPRCRRRTSPYLNNVIEQDPRFIKKRVTASLGFRSAEGACRTIEGYEAMHAMRKGRSAGSQKTIPSVSVNSSTPSSASQRRFFLSERRRPSVAPVQRICNTTVPTAGPEQFTRGMSCGTILSGSGRKWEKQNDTIANRTGFGRQGRGPEKGRKGDD